MSRPHDLIDLSPPEPAVQQRLLIAQLYELLLPALPPNGAPARGTVRPERRARRASGPGNRKERKHARDLPLLVMFMYFLTDCL